MDADVAGTVAVSTNWVVTAPEDEVIVTGFTEKDVPSAVPVSTFAVRFTLPVKPAVGVIVSVTAEAALPVATLVVATHGVIEKSGELVETTSIWVTIPVFEVFVCNAPFEVEKVISPE